MVFTRTNIPAGLPQSYNYTTKYAEITWYLMSIDDHDYVKYVVYYHSKIPQLSYSYLPLIEYELL